MKLPKRGGASAEGRLIREFVSVNPDDARSAGRVIIRSLNYGSMLDKFDKFFDAMQADMQTFVPPIELGRGDAEVTHYVGGTFGLEVPIPAGHTVPEAYTRIPTVERTR